MNRKISLIEIERAPQVGGWRFTVWFSVTTAKQFTDETCSVDGHARYWWSAVIVAWLAARREIRRLEAKPGERAAKGWAD